MNTEPVIHKPKHPQENTKKEVRFWWRPKTSNFQRASLSQVNALTLEQAHSTKEEAKLQVFLQVPFKACHFSQSELEGIGQFLLIRSRWTYLLKRLVRAKRTEKIYCTDTSAYYSLLLTEIHPQSVVSNVRSCIVQGQHDPKSNTLGLFFFFLFLKHFGHFSLRPFGHW